MTNRRFCAPRIPAWPAAGAAAAPAAALGGATGRRRAPHRLFARPRDVGSGKAHEQRAVLHRVAPDLGRVLARGPGPDFERRAARAQYPALRHAAHDARLARRGFPGARVLARFGLRQFHRASGLALRARRVLIRHVALAVDALDDTALARGRGSQRQQDDPGARVQAHRPEALRIAAFHCAIMPDHGIRAQACPLRWRGGRRRRRRGPFAPLRADPARRGNPAPQGVGPTARGAPAARRPVTGTAYTMPARALAAVTPPA